VLVIGNWDGERLIAVSLNFHTEVAHDGEGHVHVGFGVEVGGDFDLNGRLGVRRDHEEGGEKLGGDVASDGGFSAGKAGGGDVEGRANF